MHVASTIHTIMYILTNFILIWHNVVGNASLETNIDTIDIDTNDIDTIDIDTNDIDTIDIDTNDIDNIIVMITHKRKCH